MGLVRMSKGSGRGPACFYPGGFILLLALSVCLYPAKGRCSWKEVDTMLAEAYGDKVARECADYYQGLEIPEDTVPSVGEAIARLVKAGYPAGCPVEYLKAAGDLSRAGIDVSDLTSKISEGIAKKVSPERLNRVLAQRAEALQEARVLVLSLEGSGVEFLDKQMAYRVMADYLLRGVGPDDLRSGLIEGDLKSFPALDNVLR